MLAVVEVAVHPDDAVLIGQSLRSLAVDYRLRRWPSSARTATAREVDCRTGWPMVIA